MSAFLNFSVNRNDPFLTPHHGATIADESEVAKTLTPLLPTKAGPGNTWVIDYRRIWMMTTAPWLISLMAIIMSAALITQATNDIKGWQRVMWGGVLAVAIAMFTIGAAYCFDTYQRRPSTRRLQRHGLFDLRYKRGKKQALDPAIFNNSISKFIKSQKEFGFASFDGTLEGWASIKDRTAGAWSILPVNIADFLYLNQVLHFLIVNFNEEMEKAALRDFKVTQFQDFLTENRDNAPAIV